MGPPGAVREWASDDVVAAQAGDLEGVLAHVLEQAVRREQGRERHRSVEQLVHSLVEARSFIPHYGLAGAEQGG